MTDKQKSHLFQKGKSGNPGGRPKGIASLGAYIRQETKDGKELADKALMLMRTSTSEKTVTWCLEYLRDTGGWKPATSIRPVDENGDDAPLGVIYELVEPPKDQSQ